MEILLILYEVKSLFENIEGSILIEDDHVSSSYLLFLKCCMYYDSFW